MDLAVAADRPVAATAVLAMVVFAIAGLEPVAALVTFVTAPVQDLYGFGGKLTFKAAPLILIAVGLAVGFRAGVYNIGGEGQLILGVIGAGWLALTFGPSGPAWLLPAMITAGALCGAAFAANPALLRTRFNANEDPHKPDAELCRAAVAELADLRPMARSGGLQLPQSARSIRARSFRS